MFFRVAGYAQRHVKVPVVGHGVAIGNFPYLNIINPPFLVNIR